MISGCSRLSVMQARSDHRITVDVVSFDHALLESGMRVSLAVKLFDEGTLTLAQAAKFAGIGVEALIERAGAAGVTGVRTAAEELDAELEVIARHGRRR